jgi:LuxR family maltose regulon positive regulatory protein
MWIARPRLSRWFDEAIATPVVAVSGIAGAGKTTSVRHWLESTGIDHAWVALDARDNDASRFWQRLAEALAEPGRRPKDRMSFDRLEALVAALPAKRAHVVVLDDMHVIVDEGVLSDLAMLAARLPPGTRLVMTSRSRLPGAFRRLAADGRVIELGEDELAFTRAEVAELLAGDDGLAERVLRATRGWPVAVGLSRGLTPQALSSAVDEIPPRGDIADYLAREVLQSLPADMQDFVREIAVLDRLTADATNAALGIDDAERRLVDLADNGLFVTGSGTGWTMHPVLRDILRVELERRSPTRARAINRLASRHFTSSDPERAIMHAFGAGEVERVAELIETRPGDLLDVRYGTQLRWLQALPERTIRARPALRTHAAMVASYERRPDLVARWLRDREQIDPGSVEELGSRTVHHIRDGDMPRLAEVSARLHAAVDEDSTLWRLSYGALAGALVAVGDRERALTVMAGMFRTVVASPPQFLAIQSTARAVVVVLLVELGRLEDARTTLDDLRDWVAEAALVDGYSDLGATDWAAAKLGLAEGHQDAAAAWREPPPLDASFGLPMLEVWQAADFAAARLAVGDEDAARRAITRAHTTLSRFADPAELPKRVDAVGAQLGIVPLARRPVAPDPLREELSEREWDVLQLLDSDLSLREVAEHLFVSPNTLKTHLRSVYRRLGVSSRLSAVRAAQGRGLIHPPG